MAFNVEIQQFFLLCLKLHTCTKIKHMLRLNRCSFIKIIKKIFRVKRHHHKECLFYVCEIQKTNACSHILKGFLILLYKAWRHNLASFHVYISSVCLRNHLLLFLISFFFFYLDTFPIHTLFLLIIVLKTFALWFFKSIFLAAFLRDEFKSILWRHFMRVLVLVVVWLLATKVLRNCK